MPRKRIEEPEVSGQDEAMDGVVAVETHTDDPIALGGGDAATELVGNADAENEPVAVKRRTSKRSSEQDTESDMEPLDDAVQQDVDNLLGVSELSSEPSIEDCADEDQNERSPEPAKEDWTVEDPAIPDSEETPPGYAIGKAEESDAVDIDALEPCPADAAADADTAQDAHPLDSVESVMPDEQNPELPVALVKETPKPARTRKKTIHDLNLNSLDRDLTPEERQEWSSIYASYRSVRREIADYQERANYLIRSGSESAAVMERWVVKIEGLEQKKREYESVLKRELNDIDDEFSTLGYLSQELQIRARGLRVKRAA